MTDVKPNAQERNSARLFCPQCGEEMLVSAAHLRMRVACPHCGQQLDPWRLGAVATAQPVAPPAAGHLSAPGAVPVVFSWRNRWVAGTLAVLLGPFGVHRFYLGFTGIGTLQVLLTLCSAFVLTPVVAIWAFIEGILCFAGAMRDRDGLPLRG